MKCKEVQDRLYEYVYGELGHDESSNIEEHVKGCKDCMEEYMELKKLLIDDMEDLTILKDNIEVPKELYGKVETSIKPEFIKNLVKYMAAACILLSLTFATPVLAYYILQFSPIDKYVDLDKGVMVDFEEGRGQLVQKFSTMNDITLTVDGIVRKEDRTSILFTIKVPKDGDINFGLPEGGLNVITVEDQFGIKYRVQGGAATIKSVSDDGEVKCIYDIAPLHFWSYKLKVRVTAIEVGYSVDGNWPKETKNIYGNWNVDFYINRSSGR